MKTDLIIKAVIVKSVHGQLKGLQPKPTVLLQILGQNVGKHDWGSLHCHWIAFYFCCVRFQGSESIARSQSRGKAATLDRRSKRFLLAPTEGGQLHPALHSYVIWIPI